MRYHTNAKMAAASSQPNCLIIQARTYSLRLTDTNDTPSNPLITAYINVFRDSFGSMPGGGSIGPAISIVLGTGNLPTTVYSW